MNFLMYLLPYAIIQTVAKFDMRGLCITLHWRTFLLSYKHFYRVCFKSIQPWNINFVLFAKISRAPSWTNCSGFSWEFCVRHWWVHDLEYSLCRFATNYLPRYTSFLKYLALRPARKFNETVGLSFLGWENIYTCRQISYKPFFP
jgi:hypothetical protein